MPRKLAAEPVSNDPSFSPTQIDEAFNTLVAGMHNAASPEQAATYAGIIGEQFPAKANFPELEKYILATQNLYTIKRFAQHASEHYNTSNCEKFVLEKGSFLEWLMYLDDVKVVHAKDEFIKKILWDPKMINSATTHERNHYYNKLLEVPNINYNIINQWLIQWAGKIAYLSAYTDDLPWVDYNGIYAVLLKEASESYDNREWDRLIRFFKENHSHGLSVLPIISLTMDPHRGGLIYFLDDCVGSSISLPGSEIQQMIGDSNNEALVYVLEHFGGDAHAAQISIQTANEDLYLFEKIWNLQGFNINEFQIYMVNNKYVTLILQFLEGCKADGKNIPLLQQVIEKHGTIDNLGEFAKHAVKFNFKSFKKRYNDLKEKSFSPENKNDSKTSPEEILEYVQKKWVNNWASTAELKVEISQWVDELYAKRDWFFLRGDMLDKIIQNSFVSLYRIGTKKTLLQIYNESLKNSYEAVAKLKACMKWAGNPDFIALYQFIIDIASKTNNFDQFIKIAEKIIKGMDIRHNSGVDMEIIKKAILNTKFSLEDKTNVELIEASGLIAKTFQLQKKITDLNKARAGLIDETKFNHNLTLLNALIEKVNAGEPVSFKRGTPEYDAVKSMHTDLNMIKDFTAIKSYLKHAKPKNEKLKSFNLEINDFSFKVLNFLDPRAFKVGSETDCCQRIGGEGWTAAVDSFINPEASVLILNYQDKLISQSYFHYVPQENGLILDNVEANANHMRQLGLDTLTLSKLYADYAANLKANNPDLNYVKCGKGYNKIGNDLFAQDKMKEDPRHFEIEELEDEDDEEEAYSDFEENDHINLLMPSPALKNINVQVTKSASAILVKKISLSATNIRTLLLQQYGL